MIPLALEELAEIVGGEVHDAPEGLVVTGPAFLDSRAVEPGGLFVALAGEHADGHDHAPAAVAGGAAAVLGARPTGAPTVVVPDVAAALSRLAWRVLCRRRDWVEEKSLPPVTVIAITGSQGKTSAKDMLAQVLASAGPTVATYGSFNNELGLPLTVLRLTPETRYLVLEMGARGIGHLTPLCEIAPPDVSLVLNVGKAHLGEFGSQEAIAQAKGEIVEALNPASGTAVLNADDPLVSAMRERTYAAVLTFGTGEDATVRFEALALDDLGRPSFDLVHRGETAHVDLQLLGAHQAANAAATAATALAAGLELGQAAAGLASIRSLSRWRMELAERPDGLTVVNDAYNANPDSMAAALSTLAGMGERSGRRTVAVLGEMLELGFSAEAEHRAVGLLAHELGVDELVVVGEGARGIHDAVADLPDERTATRHVGTVDEAATWLRENVAGPDIVLVKASRGARLERVAQMLIDVPREEPGS